MFLLFLYFEQLNKNNDNNNSNNKCIKFFLNIFKISHNHFLLNSPIPTKSPKLLKIMGVVFWDLFLEYKYNL